MPVVRFQNGCTTTNSEGLANTIRDAKVDRVVLFASHRAIDEHPTHSGFHDGTMQALPLMAAIAEIELPLENNLIIVFDGIFLTAQSSHRQVEIDFVLDEAIKTDKVWFSGRRSDFTGSLEAEAAADVYLKHCDSLQQLSTDTRNQYLQFLR